MRHDIDSDLPNDITSKEEALTPAHVGSQESVKLQWVHLGDGYQVEGTHVGSAVGRGSRLKGVRQESNDW